VRRVGALLEDKAWFVLFGDRVMRLKRSAVLMTVTTAFQYYEKALNGQRTWPP